VISYEDRIEFKKKRFLAKKKLESTECNLDCNRMT